jgi:hypothetical protein
VSDSHLTNSERIAPVTTWIRTDANELPLPETGFLRLPDVIGEEEVTEKQAAANREFNKQAEADAIKNGRLDKNGKPRLFAPADHCKIQLRRQSFPVRKSCWWEGVKSGRFPKPVKLGPRVTVWRVEDIRNLIATA